MKRKTTDKRMSKMMALLTVIVLISVSLCACGSDRKSVPANTVNSIDDLAGKTIGVQLGTTGDFYASDIDGADVVRYDTGAYAVEALQQGDVDCVIIDKSAADFFVDKHPSLKILEDTFEEEKYAICVAKENKELYDRLNEALDTLQENGTLENIVRYYSSEEMIGTAYETPEGTVHDGGVLKMATNAEFQPYEYIKDGKMTGIDIDLAKALADQLGMELSIDNIEFDDIIPAVAMGTDDMGIAGMTVTEDRLAEVSFTDSYATSRKVIIVRKK